MSAPVLPTPVLDAIDLLHELEWILLDDHVRCPDCRAYEEAGHHEDCGLSETLRILDTEVLPQQMTHIRVPVAANGVA